MSGAEPEDVADEMTTSYRAATRDDNARPSAATREAIMAEARRVAATAPAANDSWWTWKAAAGIAVVGLVGILAVRVFRTETVLPTPPAAHVSERTPADAPPAAPPPTVQREAISTDEFRTAPAPKVLLDRVAANRAPPDAADTATAAAIASSGAISSEKTQAEFAAGGAAPQRAERDLRADDGRTGSAMSLVQRYFPEAFAATSSGQRLWILFDGQGRVLRTGSMGLAAAEQLAVLLEQEFPGIKVAGCDAGVVRDPAGQSANYAFCRLAADSGPLAATP